MTSETSQLLVPTKDLKRAKDDFATHGYCMLENALDRKQIDDLTARLLEQAEAEKQNGTAFEDGGPTQNWGQFQDENGRIRSEAFTEAAGGVNQRVWMLVNKGKVFHPLLFHKEMRSVVDHVLGDEYILSSYSANIAKPGGVSMPLHTDQWWMPQPTRRGRTPLPVGSMTRERFDVDGDGEPSMIAPCVVVNVLWMLNGFSVENGGTRVVPESHLRGVQPKSDDTAEARAIASEGPPGTALLLDGRTWHGTGANVSEEPRLALLMTFCAPMFRPQANMTIGTHPEVLEDASPELLALLGFKVWSAYGRVDSPAVEFVKFGERSAGEMTRAQMR